MRQLELVAVVNMGYTKVEWRNEDNRLDEVMRVKLL